MAEKVQEGVNFSTLLALMEHHMRFLSDFSFDNLCASAAVSSASIAAQRNIWMRSWKADAAQNLVLLKLPFTGSKVFGNDLEDMIKKSVENLKLVTPVCPASSGRSFGFRRAFPAEGKTPQNQPFRGRGRIWGTSSC